MAIAKPIQFHKNNASESLEGGCRLLPTPSRLKSTATLVPIHSDNPVKWVACTKG